MLKSKILIKKVLHFTSRFTRQPSSGEGITFGGTKIEILLGKQETYYNNMGVTMNNNLSFSAHNNQGLNYICKKNYTIAMRSMGRIQKYLSLAGLKCSHL